jgi:hypothetical protein
VPPASLKLPREILIVINTAVVLIATLVSGAGLAQTAIAQTASSAATAAGPVAYVYVTRPTHLDAFSVSSSGKLTPVPGSPYSGIALYHLSVTKKFLFGGSDDHIHINSYSIASNGAVKQVSSVNALNFAATPGCCRLPQRLDASGTTLYNLTDDSGDQAVETFHIASDGHLQFIGNTSSNGGGTNYEPGMISILGNNKFAYSTGCDEDVTTEQLTRGFKRESSGLLQRFAPIIDLPTAKAGDIYCPYALASDPSSHLAFVLRQLHLDVDEGEPDGSFVLASYTSDSNGNLTTQSTKATMPALASSFLNLSISPSSKLVAAGGGGGFQVFHFNGSAPIAKYTGVFHSSENFLEFGWDKSNHLFALSQNALHVYSATSSSVKELPGSPYSIPQASSVIVLSLQ